MAPVVHGLAKRYEGRVDFLYLDIADPRNEAAKARLGFVATPHFFFLRADGSRVGAIRGVVPEDSLVAALDALIALGARPVHDDGRPDQAQQCAGDVGRIGTTPVDAPPPQEGQGNEDTAIRGVDAAEIGGLVRCRNAIEGQQSHAECTQPGAPAIAQPLPHEVPAADFQQASEGEEGNGSQHWGVHV